MLNSINFRLKARPQRILRLLSMLEAYQILNSPLGNETLFIFLNVISMFRYFYYFS